MTRRSLQSRVGIVAAGLSLALLGACSSGTSEAADPSASASSGLISADRCAANQAAGTVTYLTQYSFAAMPSTLDVISAEELGYFDDLCLDVDIRSNTDNNAQIVSAGTAQLAGLGSASDVLTARDADAKDIVSVATYGNETIIELLTMADSGIESLADFSGKTVGYKISLAPQLQAMFANEGVDPASINWVSVGFDPQILPDGQVQGLGAYKSNEPKVLAARDYEVDQWDPAEYGVDSTFNVMIANTAWAAENPTAVEDFLRATFHAYAWINESDDNLMQSLGWAEQRSEAGYDVELSKLRWQTESGLVESSKPEGWGVGKQTEEQWQPEADLLVEYDLVKSTPSIADSQENSYLDAIYDGDQLIWPAP